jgi:hypothetical protein
MGQKIGKPVPVDSAVKFLNLPREALESLWASYNLLGEGWGVDCADFNCIVAETPFLIDNLGMFDVNNCIMCARSHSYDDDHDIYLLF